ncbi:MAG: hypothetical protein COA99_17870 [Moraxellaceae bacterium]|nr:MAG: hypothetical protein COA99_17870 [Moraxellaceae bacterium]
MNLRFTMGTILMFWAVFSIVQAAEPPTANTAYKWIDAEGNTHYVDKYQRPANTDVEAVKLPKTSPPKAENPVAVMASAETCKSASRIVEAMSKTNTTINTRDENGEERPMTEQERDDLMVKQSALMEANCLP